MENTFYDFVTFLVDFVGVHWASAGGKNGHLPSALNMELRSKNL